MLKLKRSYMGGFPQKKQGDEFMKLHGKKLLAFILSAVMIITTLLMPGTAFAKIGESDSKKKAEYVEGEVICVLNENASREFSQRKVRQMIKHQRDKYNWEFLFFGANIDSEAVADTIGVCPSQAFNFEASSKGIKRMNEACCQATAVFRNN